ncbi:MocR-like pyridoxine biosynthesis transcription factor PdxR [Paenibacillus sp. DMB20]|uniref:MocR-like pyridoxine biosynthesis transcription factor PdxR n=1 Tax=Paenibacillus sp. DMB20 TaxID=1642570 RepID=UPI000627E48B|nr:PLP-dependent aminotransferase family protein [Paenibacillus sp. DMB20]KKO53534.1 transcriptional regulator [Paenibacillus sp. DMB20]
MNQVSIHLNGISPALADPSVPLYVQLYQYMKKEIACGRWKAEARLPSVRKLAELLGVSTTPIEMCYQQLLAEGFILSRPRSGYFVRKLADSPIPLPPEPEAPKGQLLRRHHSFRYDFHMSKNEYGYFPIAEWRKAYNRTLRHENAAELLFFGDPQGEKGLRYEIAKYARSVRGVSCSPEQVVIASDPYPLLDIICRLLRPYGNVIAVEDPGYPQYPEVFRRNGYQVIPVPLKEDGIDLDLLRGSHAGLAVVSPSHQFPAGMVMPFSKRLALLQWIQESGGFLIEDDYDGEFRYYGRPIPCMQGLIPDSRVIYLGGFSQVLSPALGIQYMILPSVLLEDYHHLKHQLFLECTASRLHQHTLERFMREGYVDRHLRKMRAILRKKHDQLMASAGRHFGKRAFVSGTGAGFHLMLSLRHPLSEAELELRAEKQGIRIHSAAYTRFHSQDSSKGSGIREFIVGFGGIQEKDIDDGIRLLASCWLEEVE